MVSSAAHPKGRVEGDEAPKGHSLSEWQGHPCLLRPGVSFQGRGIVHVGGGRDNGDAPLRHVRCKAP